jgi:hypothetical protein
MNNCLSIKQPLQSTHLLLCFLREPNLSKDSTTSRETFHPQRILIRKGPFHLPLLKAHPAGSFLDNLKAELFPDLLTTSIQTEQPPPETCQQTRFHAKSVAGIAIKP